MSDPEAEMAEASSVPKAPMTTTDRVVTDVTPPATKRLTIDDVYAADGSINLEAVSLNGSIIMDRFSANAQVTVPAR
jgi:hypothetical protein